MHGSRVIASLSIPQTRTFGLTRNSDGLQFQSPRTCGRIKKRACGQGPHHNIAQVSLEDFGYLILAEDLRY